MGCMHSYDALVCSKGPDFPRARALIRSDSRVIPHSSRCTFLRLSVVPKSRASYLCMIATAEHRSPSFKASLCAFAFTPALRGHFIDSD
ncbi:hypothetical protein VTO73DRAFT_8025 [Trametes versicolor]